MKSFTISNRNAKRNTSLLFLMVFCLCFFVFASQGYAADDPKTTILTSHPNTMASLNEVDSPSGTGGAPLLSASSGNEDTLYQAIFVPRAAQNGLQKHWTGDLFKYVYITDNDTSGYVLSSSWGGGAYARLAAMKPIERIVYTSLFQDVAGDSNNMVPINDDLLEYNIMDFAYEIGFSTINDADRLVQWFRGYEDVYSATNHREDKLFDIFHSGLVIVGPPNAGIPDSDYIAFKNLHKDRDTIIYAQSNAGLLHAFDDSDGKEKWAFLAPNVRRKNRLRGLKWDDAKKTDDYITIKDQVALRYLADGPTVAEDVYFDGGYRTILFVQLGFGGAGMYTLDITDPENPKFLWAVENPLYKKNNNYTLLWLGAGNDYSIAPSGYDYSNLQSTGSSAFVGYFNNDKDEPTWVFLLGNGAALGATNIDAECVYMGKISDGSRVTVFLPPGGIANGPIVTPVAVPFASDKKPRHIEKFYVGDIEGNLLKGELPKNAALMNESIVMECIFKLQANMGFSYTLDVATIDGEDWLFTGTGDLEKYSPPPPNMTSNYFFAINASKFSNNNRGDINSLDSIDREDNDDSFDETKGGWYLNFEYTNGNPRTMENISTAPVVVNGVVYFATTTMEYDNKGVYTGNIINSRVYAIDVKTGKPIDAWTWKDDDGTTVNRRYFEIEEAMVSGISISGKRLVLGVTFQDDIGDKRVWEHTGFLRLGENILYTKDVTGGAGGSNDPETFKNMTPLYWKTR